MATHKVVDPLRTNSQDFEKDGHESVKMPEKPLSLYDEVCELLEAAVFLIYNDLMIQKEALDEKRGAIDKRNGRENAEVFQLNFSIAKFARVVDALKEDRMLNNFHVKDMIKNIRRENVIKETKELEAKIKEATAQRNALRNEIISKYKELFDGVESPAVHNLLENIISEMEMVRRHGELKTRYASLKQLLRVLQEAYSRVCDTPKLHRK